MGQPQPAPQPLTGAAQLSAQHERLLLELLPFKDARQFHEWLNSVYVLGSWHEFVRDYLAREPLAVELDKSKTAQKAKDALNSRKPEYLMYHPDKTAWTAEDHHVRFIVTVISDNMLKGLWSESDWKKRSIEIAKAVYEVLAFMRATHSVPDANPPRYEG
ncbi:3b8bad45-5dfc-499e-a157-fa039836b43d [Thermothielavioides terrestris]|uniref:3b8bad45-5dfc-499e-a157-fa039836b43d n=1 Tax=Thermothielavioides terrestris TaxID=2587410 RepID=A0A446BRV5_9PEZI|nr:3b8bad45-5dfc-499e-a157-fa039836b43d [Thermothielavioides terrestris]